MDKIKRFQIIFPFTSTKLHSATDINKGAKLCYKEIATAGYPVFIVHALDTNELYHYEIPKFKKQHNSVQTAEHKVTSLSLMERVDTLEHKVDEINSKLEQLSRK